jgi:LmbE family N-acetylglucosaminyl deacetylase
MIILFLFAPIAAISPKKAQFPDAALPTASPDGGPLQIDSGAAGLWQTLLKLHTRASLLMIGAHPDDEDGGMLTLESRGQGARAMMLTLTRGEGGQNVMSGDFEDALGLVRTQELLSTDRYLGVEEYFGSVVDFGFSKTATESLSLWGHDRVLADVVRVVRMTRPLVVTSVFVGGRTDGHGQHSVAGQIAQEVFSAAGDPSMFPDQIRAGLRPWSPLKMYARAPTFSDSLRGILNSTISKYFPVRFYDLIHKNPVRFYDFIHKKWIYGELSVDVEIPEGNLDPILKTSYLHVAREGLALQKSQIGSRSIPDAGPVSVPYHRYASQVPASGREGSFFDGIDISLTGISNLAPAQSSTFLKEGLSHVDALVERAMHEFSFEHPEKIAPLLAQGLEGTNALAARVSASDLSEEAKYNILHELTIKQDQFQHAIIESLGFSVEATVAPRRESLRGGFVGVGRQETFAYAVPGYDFAVKVHLDNPAGNSLKLDRIWLETPAGESWTVTPESRLPATLPAGHALDQRFGVRVSVKAAATRPYFVRPNDEQAYYDIKDDRYLNRPLSPYPVTAWVKFGYEGVAVHAGQVVQTVRQLNGLGTVFDPLMVAPAVSVRTAPRAGIMPVGARSFAISALVRTEVEAGAKGTVRLDLPLGWRSEPVVAPFEMRRAGQEQKIGFQVFPSRLEEKAYTLTAVAESASRQYYEGFTTAGYQGLRPYNLYVPATYRTSAVDFQVAPGLRAGYVAGTGDAVPQSLESIGVKSEFLSPHDLAQSDLQKFDVILLGIRTYTVRPELASNNGRLLEYVRNGGVLIVQYQSVEYDHNYGPYPYRLPYDAEKVVDEHCPVTFPDPKDPLLTWPNQINESDFAGWVEERGHNFMKSWDSHYKSPLEMHDVGQDPQKGGLIYSRYGRGVYVYVSFALYRQLPDGVPGAYRLFANLLSLPRNSALRQDDAATVRPSPR